MAKEEIVKRLEEKGISLYDVVKMTVDKWYHTQPRDSLYFEACYEYDTNEVFVDSRFPGEIHEFKNDVVNIFTLKPNWIDEFDLAEDFWDTEQLEKIEELRQKGLSDVEILKELGEDPVEYISQWIIGNFVADGIADWEDFER
jgi:hypothetical protein